MKEIKIGFSTHKGFAPGSKLIRWYTKRDFSHTYFKYKDSTFTDHTIFHAVGKGLSYVSETNFLKHNTVVREFTMLVPDELFHLILNICHQKSGQDYGYLQNLGILIVELLSKVGIKLKENIINDGVNCSELMCYLLTEVHGKWIKKDADLVTPADVYDFLVKKYG